MLKQAHSVSEIEAEGLMKDNMLISELKNGVLYLTLNRPKVNALNIDLITALQAAFQQAAQDPLVRCVLLSGAGSVFSAGQDIGDFNREGISIRAHLLRTYNPLILQIRTLEKPVLVAIRGAISGAALGLALACDLRIAAQGTRFVVGFLGIGLAPDSAVSLLLPALIGLGRAAQVTYFNQPFSAEQAFEWGLVNCVVASDRLMQEAQAWAEELTVGPTSAIGLAKRAFNKAILPNLEAVLDYEAYLQDIAGKGAEHKEGIAAFWEKRPPKFN